MKTVIDKFGSFAEMLAYAKDNKAPRDSDSASYSFCHTHNLSEAITLAYDGWQDERPAVDEMVRNLSDQLGERMSKENRAFVGFAGGAVHMGNFMAGLPNHMVAFRRVPTSKHGKVVRILLDYGAQGAVSADVMRKRGAVIVVLLDALAKLGISLELWGETTVNVGTLGKHTTLVQLHDPREPLDIDSLMFQIAHPSMLRRVTFSVREKSEYGVATMASNGYGRSIPITQGEALEADVVINRTEHGGDPRMVGPDPVAWVMETINGLGLGA